MKTYPYHTPEGIIELVEQQEYDDLFKKLCEAEELIREIRDDEVNAQDEADKFLRDHKPSELAKMRADNAELLERLRERTESHLAASARDVQTIQRQSVLLERLANELHGLANMPEHDQDDAHRLRHIAGKALDAYESANLAPISNPVDEAVKRMKAVPALELNKLHFDAFDYGNFNDIEAIRARLISAAKGEQP